MMIFYLFYVLVLINGVVGFLDESYNLIKDKLGKEY